MKDIAIAALEATGYLSENGSPAEGLVLPDASSSSAGDATRLGSLLSTTSGGLNADAVFRVGTSPVVLFKSSDAPTRKEAEWHRIAWNFGVAPLLWVTTPEYVRLYNAYQPPQEYGRVSPLLIEFPMGDALNQALKHISSVCGRRNIAMGSFWNSTLARKIDRQSRVDYVLLRELGLLLAALVRKGLRPALAQKLVGRCVFFQYLLHRGYLTESELVKHFVAPNLHSILADLESTYRVFRWIRTTFNGDLFPIEDEACEREQLAHSAERLQPLSDFFGHFSVEDGQGRLFPFRFDAIPVELISSIYESFVHMSVIDGASRSSIHYTPINLVDLVLDPVFEDVGADACVLDPACGSGVFLVESLRRLAWLRSQHETLNFETIRDILINQIRGVDISPAAISVATFSLYLAHLELDPSPPNGIEALNSLRFEPLQDKVLFAASAFEHDLKKRLLPQHSRGGFDIIVGNPPWTYVPKEKAADRELSRRNAAAGKNVPSQSLTTNVPAARSGTTFAREKGYEIPPRSADWPFLWRSHELGHNGARIALVMKATPFFSLASKARAARNAALRAFPKVALVNLSQLRTSRLFQEHKDGTVDTDVKRKKQRIAGPGILFFSNCLPANPDCVTVIGFPWSSTFKRVGVFEMPADPPKAIRLDMARKRPGLLKAAAFGTDRDVWFLERLARNSRVCSFAKWCEQSDLPAGEGYQEGSRMDAAHLIGLPRVRAKDMKHGRLATALEILDSKRVHRARKSSLFRGPLVLLPEGSLTRAPIVGRYTAAYDKRDLAYNSSFCGVSFHGRSPALAQALAAVMHSRLVAYQLAMMGGTVGIKQTKIEVVDLGNLRLPPIQQFRSQDLRELSTAYEILTSNQGTRDLLESADLIDQIVETAAELSDSDRDVLVDAERRTRSIFFETNTARSPMLEPPEPPEINLYARNLCTTFNAFASHADDQALAPDCYVELDRDLVMLKFTLTKQKEMAPAPVLKRTRLNDLDSASLRALGGTDLPYVKPAKNMRLYTEADVLMLKPAQYRYFLPAAGQSDADRIIADLMNPVLPNE